MKSNKYSFYLSIMMLMGFLIVLSLSASSYTIHQDDIMMEYRFDGNLNDNSRFANTGNAYLDNFNTTDYIIGQSLNDWTDDGHVNFTDAVQQKQPFSNNYVIWFFAKNYGLAQWTNFFNKGTGDSTACFEWDAKSTTTTKTWIQFNNRGFAYFPSPDLDSISGFDFWTFVRNGTGGQFFVNGTMKASGTYTNFACTSTAPWRIGRGWGNDHLYKGLFDELVFLNDTILSGADVTSIYNDYKSGIRATDPPALSNTTFNVTNYNDLISNSTAWASASYINVSRNLISMTFTLSYAANSSCSIHNLNYTSMVASYPSSKLTTTETTSMSTNAVYGNLTAYNSTTCIYCAYSTGTVFGSSGCLKAMYSDIIEPKFNRTSISPSPFSFFDIINDRIKINVNITDDSAIPSKTLYHKTNFTFLDYAICTAGLCSNAYYPVTNFTLSGNNHTFSISENGVFPATYNINQPYMENASKSATATTSLKTYHQNIITNLTWGILEFMANTTGSSTLDIYYCNSTYTAGNFQSSPYCGQIGIYPAGKVYNHTHSINSKHNVISFSSSNGYISGIKLSNASYIIYHANTNWNFYSISNDTATMQSSGNNGVTYSNVAGTFDSHIHQGGFTNFYDYTCANDTWRNYNCSSTTTTQMLFYDLPPTSPSFITPTSGYYKGNISVSWNNATSTPSVLVTYDELNLYAADESLISTIANLTANSYTWNTENISDGNYILGITAYTNNTDLTSSGFSDDFIIDKTPPSCDRLIVSTLYHDLIGSSSIDVSDALNLSWIQLTFNGTILFNDTISGNNVTRNDDLNVTQPINSTVVIRYDFSDLAGNENNCSRSTDVEEAPVPPTPFLEFGVCPSTTIGIILLILVFIIAMTFVILGLLSASILGMLGSIILLFFGFLLIGCENIIGMIVCFIAILLCFMFGTMLVRGK